MKRFLLILGGALLIAGVYLSTFTVNPNEFVVITQFGKTIRTVEQAGLYFKLPGFIQSVNRIDKRISVFRTQPIQLLFGDKNPIIISCYVCWRVSEPLLFHQSLTVPAVAQQKLGDMIISQLGSVLGDYSLDRIINTDEDKVEIDEIEHRIRTTADERARSKYGITVVRTGLCRINYPSIVADAVYNRMRAEREKEAKKYRAEGMEEAAKIEAKTDGEVTQILAEAYRQAETTKGEGDREALRIYADAFGQDPAFFAFLRSMDLYREILKSKSTLVLSTDSELFKYLNIDPAVEAGAKAP
ncbi:protease modulator HflC [bacterium]|nr:protease modulator HflC [candidate division CSSED10-310 bacterium]